MTSDIRTFPTRPSFQSDWKLILDAVHEKMPNPRSEDMQWIVGNPQHLLEFLSGLRIEIKGDVQAAVTRRMLESGKPANLDNVKPLNP